MQQTGSGSSSQQNSAHQLILTSPQGELPQSNSSESNIYLYIVYIMYNNIMCKVCMSMLCCDTEFLCSYVSTGPLYVMIPPSSSAEILQAMGQSRPIAPKGVPVL